MNQITEQFTVIASISYSRIKYLLKGNMLYNLVFSKFVTLEPLDLDLDIISKRLQLLNFIDYHIFVIIRDKNFTFNYSIFNNFDNSLNLSIYNPKYQITKINHDFFFKTNYLINKTIFEKNKESYEVNNIFNEANNSIFIFLGYKSWLEICMEFRYHNLILGGGSITKRGDLSPVHNNLSQFLTCAYGKSKKKIKESYHRVPEINKRTLIDLNGPEAEKLITKYSDLKEKQIKNSESNINKDNNDNKNDNINNTSINIENKKEYHTFSYNKYNKNITPLSIQKREFHSSIYFNQNLTNIIKYKESECINHIDNIINKNDLFKDFKINPLFNRISQILNDKEKSNDIKQLNIEKTLQSFWKDEIYQLFKSDKKLFGGGYGLSFLIKYLKKLDRDFNDLKNDTKFFKNKNYKFHLLYLENQMIISIVLCNIIPNCFKYNNVNNQDLVSLYEKIGKDIIKTFYNEEWYKYSQNKNNYTFNIKSINNLSKIDDINIFCNNLTRDDFIIKINKIVGDVSFDDYFKLGSDLTEFIAIKTDLYILYNKKNYDSNNVSISRQLIPGDGINEFILKILTVDTDVIPMICTPQKWDVDINNNNKIISYGGFLLNSDNKKSFLRISPFNIGNIKLVNLNIINTINYLSCVKYTINIKLLYFIINLFEYKDSPIYKYIKLNIHPKTKDIYKLNLAHKTSELNEIYKHNSEYYNDKFILQNALLFLKWCTDGNSLHFPYFIDWRGRLYTDTSYFSFQSGELSRSLLSFKDGYILNDKGVEALKIYTANCYGLNKLSYNQRVEWVDSNIDNIKKIEVDFIFKADSPLLFLACCLELIEYINNPTGFKSRLPIYLDATCSGLQHLSSMINDSNLAKHVNIIKSDRNDLPNDVYKNMVVIINDDINNLIIQEPKYANISKLMVNRKFIKRGIMTIPYGVTKLGICQQLRNDHFLFYKKIEKKDVYTLIDDTFNKNKISFYLNNKEIYCLAQIIHDVLYDSFPILKILVTYLKSMNKTLKNLYLNTIWLTPSGLIIEQKYVENRKIELVTSILGKKKYITIRKPIKDKINLRKQNEGIVPNIVHSFDASNISLLIKQLLKNNNNINILTIHDCFATHANNIELMSYYVKLAFLLLYLNNKFVNSYHNFIIDYLQKSGYIIIKNKDNYYICSNNKKIIIPSIPEFEYKNDFVENVLGSKYFIN